MTATHGLLTRQEGPKKTLEEDNQTSFCCNFALTLKALCISGKGPLRGRLHFWPLEGTGALPQLSAWGPSAFEGTMKAVLLPPALSGPLRRDPSQSQLCFGLPLEQFVRINIFPVRGSRYLQPPLPTLEFTGKLEKSFNLRWSEQGMGGGWAV